MRPNAECSRPLNPRKEGSGKGQDNKATGN